MSSLRAAVVRARARTTFSPRRLLGTQANSSKPSASLPIRNAPGWSEALATASEAVVKADRASATMEEMRQETVDYQSLNRDPEVEQTHAAYAREEIGGPLSNAGVGEFEGVVGKEDLGPEDAPIESNGRIVTRRRTVTHKTSSAGSA